ncbi:MAG: DUF4437 domain-containing protein [Lewinella sp.]|uniref:DUF4437 domain-containing protein n=1 Tax=Lewinella sp. TaxID=2004506 RepID=UPI003D6AE6BA
MIRSKIFFSLLMVGLLTACAEPQEAAKSEDIQIETPVESTNEVVLAADIEWEKLNPARGDQSPQAGTIWGDRKGTVATGFLAKFVDGFSSPPHIHNVTYRALVIKGMIHNDDPAAEKMWMPAGSFWTQPAGESHITAAKGEENIAYVEISSGPYLVKPIEEASDNGERPINIDKSNIVWLDASAVSWNKSDAKIAFLWEEESENLSGKLLQLPAGFKGEIHTKSGAFRAVVIQGEPAYKISKEAAAQSLAPGSSFSSEGASIHRISSSTEESTIYIRTDGEFDIVGEK